jgi:hypothetical protein
VWGQEVWSGALGPEESGVLGHGAELEVCLGNRYRLGLKGDSLGECHGVNGVGNGGFKYQSTISLRAK